jgi:hypothetical protein
LAFTAWKAHEVIVGLSSPNRRRSPVVFISHSSKDRSIADAICNQLEAAGIPCWIAPRDIEVGSDWTRGIMEGIARCRVFVLVFSDHANDSEHVGEHFKPGARKSRGVVRLIGWPRNGTRFSARSLLCPRLDLGDPPDALAALSRTIRKHPGRSSRPLDQRERFGRNPHTALNVLSN